jgi:hypothetical protein
MPSIFISYRISDSNDITGRICDHLRQRFGAEEVFRDESVHPAVVKTTERIFTRR